MAEKTEAKSGGGLMGILLGRWVLSAIERNTENRSSHPGEIEA